MNYPVIRQQGRCSQFGGPHDLGMKPDEGVALYGVHAQDPHRLFLPGKVGLGRGLNPGAMYCAMRWDYKRHPRNVLTGAVLSVTNPANARHVFVRPVDWGPNDITGRLIDLSQGAMDALGVKTDDEVIVSGLYDGGNFLHL